MEFYSRRQTTLTAVLAATLCVLALDDSTVCAQGRLARAVQAVKEGDVKICRKIAKKTTSYAIDYYKIQRLVAEADIKRTRAGMFEFLKWKLGSPTLVTAQWVSRSYNHFNNAYKDEAAAMLLGVIDFQKRTPELKMPPVLQDYLQRQAGHSGKAISAFLVSQGVPPAVAKLLGGKVEKALQNLIERNKAGVFLPKSWDVPNKFVTMAIRAKKAGREISTTTVPRGGNGGGSKRKHKFGKTSSGGSPRVLNPFGKDAPLDNSGGDSPRSGDDTGRETNGLESRVASLELRLARIEAVLRALARIGVRQKEQLRQTVAPGAIGYSKFNVSVRNHTGSAVRVYVNGSMVGMYSSHAKLDLSPFLSGNGGNEISYTVEAVEGQSPEGIDFQVHGYMTKSKKFFTLYQFVTSKKKHADSIKLPALTRDQ